MFELSYSLMSTAFVVGAFLLAVLIIMLLCKLIVIIGKDILDEFRG